MFEVHFVKRWEYIVLYNCQPKDGFRSNCTKVSFDSLGSHSSFLQLEVGSAHDSMLPPKVAVPV